MAGVHPRVLGYLGRALSLEFTAVQKLHDPASLAGVLGRQRGPRRTAMRRENGGKRSSCRALSSSRCSCSV